MAWSDQRTRIRRYLRDPDGNIWSDALLLNLYNDEQAYIASKVSIDANVQAVRIPGKFQSGYMHDLEYTHSGYATRHPYQFGYYDDKNDYVYLHKWEIEHIEALSSASTSCEGSTYTHPWEAFVSGVTPSEPPPFPLPVDFYSVLDLYWDRKPLDPTTRQEIQERDMSWRTHGGYPTHYYRHDELEDWIYLWPRPSIGSTNWQDYTDGESDPDEAEYKNNPELLANEGFESGGAAPDLWTAINADLDRHADPNTGTYCLEINENGTTNPSARQTVSVTAGLNYVYSFYIKKGTGTSYQFRIWDVLNARTIPSKLGTATTSYVQFSDSFTVPTGCTSIFVVLYHLASAAAGTTVLYDDISLKLARLDVDNNLLVIFKKETEDFDADADVSALPSFLTKYIEYGVIARAYKANTDGRIESLAVYWEWRKEIGLKVLAAYKSKRHSARRYRLRTPGIPWRHAHRHPRLPDTAITTS